MKKVIRYVLYVMLLVVVVVGVLLTYLKTALPDVGEAADLKIDYTPERIKRGEYLANHVTVCMDCHSKRDWSKFSGPLVPGTLGQGGERFDQSMGLPGVYISKNITPTAIGRYTDGELMRVITTGVTKEGRAMFPLMPYKYYGRMHPEDVYSIIAYIRSISPVSHETADSESDFPVNFIINTFPEKANPAATIPDKSDVLAYGAYMVNATACVECHTREEKGQIITEFSFGGGRAFKFPDGTTVRSANITPDPKTGIGNWSEEAFIARFKVFADSSFVIPPVAPGDYNSIMPWTMYAHMEREDLAAIYAYLRTVKPIENVVEKFTPTSSGQAPVNK